MTTLPPDLQKVCEELQTIAISQAKNMDDLFAEGFTACFEHLAKAAPQISEPIWHAWDDDTNNNNRWCDSKDFEKWILSFKALLAARDEKIKLLEDISEDILALAAHWGHSGNNWLAHTGLERRARKALGME